MIKQQLNLDNASDYRKAEAAIKLILKDEGVGAGVDMEDDDGEMDSVDGDDEREATWLEKPDSRSFLLLKLQRAFCAR